MNQKQENETRDRTERQNRTIKLTARTVARLKPEPDKQVDYFDKDLPAFCIRVSPSGYRSYCVFYRRGRQLRRLTLGSTTALTLADARKKAKDALHDVSDGRDPGAEKIELRAAGTFGELAELYMQQHGKKKAEKSQVEDQRQIDAYLLPRWKHVNAASITIDDVETLLDCIVQRAPVQANRVRSLLRHMYRWALSKRSYRRQFALTMNPVADVPRPAKEYHRERVYSDAELKAIWTACDAIGTVGSLFKLQLLTCTRPGEVSAMEWPHVDLSAATWTQPGTKADGKNGTKNRKVHVVPLAPAAVRILDKMKKEQSESKNDRKRESRFVFQNPRNPAESIRWLQKAAERIKENAELDELDDNGEHKKLKDFRPHDLRRTVRTRLAQMGIPEAVAEKIMNHVAGGVKGVYDQYSYFGERQQALESWARNLTVIVSGLQNVKAAKRLP